MRFFTLFCVLVGWARAAAGEAESPEVPEVVITGSRSPHRLSDSPVAVEVIRRQEMEQTGDRTVADTLERMAGMNVTAAMRGQAVVLQGLSGHHVLVLVDGERQTGLVGGSFDLTRVPIEQVERIEVIKGAASALYGSEAIGGVVNIITRVPKDGFGGMAVVTGDSHGGVDGSLSIDAGNADHRGHLTVTKLNGPAVDLDKSNPQTNLNAYDLNRVTAKFNTRLSENFDLGFRYGHEDRILKGIGATGGGAVLDTTILTRTDLFALQPVFTPNASSEWRLKAGVARTDDEFKEDQRGDDALDRGERSAEGHYEYSLIHATSLNPDHHLTAGVDIMEQELASDRLEEKQSERTRSGAFMQYEWWLGTAQRVAIVPGLRGDSDSQFGEHVSPKLGLRWDPNTDLTLRMSYGNGYRAPDFKELYLRFENPQAGYRVEGNPDLEPEESESFTANAEWHPDRDTWLAFGMFNNFIHNLITSSPVASEGPGTVVYSYTNAKRARTRGFELQGRQRLTDHWQFGGSYTFLEAKDLDTEQTLQGRALHMGGLGLTYNNKSAGLKGSLNLNAVGRRPFYTETASGETTTWASPYRNVSLQLGKTFYNDLEVFGGVRNLTDETHIRHHIVPPRNYFAGVKARF